MEKDLYNFNLNNLKYFYMIAKLGSFTKVSDFFCISQPNISYSIKQLENYFGVKLFDRDRKGVKLTQIGEKIYNKIEDLFSNIDECNLIAKEGQNRQTISVGIQSHVYLFFKDEIKDFLKQRQNVNFVFHQDSTQELIEKLKINQIDLIIDVAPISLTANNLYIKNIASERLCFISKTPIATPKDVSIHDILDQKFILPSSQSNIRKSLDLVLNSQNIVLTPSYICNSTDVTIDLVKAGIGIGYLFESAVKQELKNKELYKINVDFDLPQIPLCMVLQKKKRNPLIEEFIKFLENKKREVC